MSHEKRIYMQYLGAMSLLGRMVGKVRPNLTPDDQDSVDRAFEDVNRELKRRDSLIIFDRGHHGGWSSFEVSQLAAIKKRTSANAKE